MATTTGNLPALLEPGLHAIFDSQYNRLEKQYPMIFDERMSTKFRETIVSLTDLGLARRKSEDGGIDFIPREQGFEWTFQHVVWAIGTKVSEEMKDDNQYDAVALDADAIAFSIAQTEETVAALVLDRGFNTSYTFGDGQPLFSASHPNGGSGGGTWSNRPSVDSDLTEASLEQACIDIRGFTTDKGGHIAIKPNRLIVRPENWFNAHRIYDSALQNDTNLNALNVLKSLQMFPGGIHANDYITDTNAWYIRTDCPLSMITFLRKGPLFDRDREFETRNFCFIGMVRRSFGTSNPRGMYGCPGSS